MNGPEDMLPRVGTGHWTSHSKGASRASTGAGGLELASALKRRLSALNRSLAGLLWKILAVVSRPIREGMRSEPPAAPTIGAIGEALRCLAKIGEGAAAQQAAVISPGFFQWAQGERGVEGALLPLPIGVLEGHDSAGLNPRRLQGNLGNLVNNAATFACFHGALASLPQGFVFYSLSKEGKMYAEW